MSIDVTAKLLNSMQEELKEMSRRNVFTKEASLMDSEDKGKQKEAEALEQDCLILLSLIRNIETKLIAELKGTVGSLVACYSRKWLRILAPTPTPSSRSVESTSDQGRRCCPFCRRHVSCARNTFRTHTFVRWRVSSDCWTFWT